MDREKAILNLQPKKRKFPWSTAIMLLMLIVGAGIMAYPTFSDWWNSMHQSRAIATYTEAVEAISDEEMHAALDEAAEFNRGILRRENVYLLSEEEKEEYSGLLDFSGTGVMGYIQIPNIGVNLPIYHGTEESVLQTAIGHLDWTSLPVGGESTHSVLSGHRGLPSARLFTDLDKLKVGDIFTITVLKQTITYQVDQILIVLPEETSELQIVSGKDYCSLVTCTPYGINTHRMLVRGARIENTPEKKTVVVLPDAVRIPNSISIPAVGIPMLFLFLLGMVLYYRFRPAPLDEEAFLRRLRKEYGLDQSDESQSQEKDEEDHEDRSPEVPVDDKEGESTS